jgi:hypothetical protein
MTKSKLVARTIQQTTKDWYRKFLTDEELGDLDLSYITQEFLDKFAETATEKDPELVKKELEGRDQKNELTSYCYWGHHHTVEQISSGVYKHGWINDNTSNGCDSESNKCWGTQSWTATNVVSQTTGGGCPSNSQSGYSWWAGSTS